MEAGLYVVLFFFASRRRHTRFKCDWSSDVCSSDLFTSSPIAELVKSVMLGFGYGDHETPPALSYMKLMGWLVKPSLTQGLEPAQYFTFPTGYQSIWEAVAQGLDVRLQSEVTSIARPSPTGAPIQITINGTDKFDFDEVVISAPLHRVSKFMSLGTDESDLFAQVASERYDVSLFGATGVTTD